VDWALIRELAEEFGIELAETCQVRVEALDNRVNRLLRLKLDWSNVYLLETPALVRYACFPHICGDPVLSLLSSNSDAVRAVINQFSLERFGRLLIHGRLAEALNLPYPRALDANRPGDVVLISSPPDLSPESLRRIAYDLERRGGRMRVIFAIGFLSLEDLRCLDDAANSLGANTVYLSFLLLGRRTQEGEIYLYGYDARGLRRGEVRGVGSIVDAETLGKMIQEYPPSTDISLTDGRLSGSLDYLESSLERMLLLLEHPLFDSWQVENILREAKAIRREMERRKRDEVS